MINDGRDSFDFRVFQMLTRIPSFVAAIAMAFVMVSPAAAQAPQSAPKTYAASWAIVLFCVILGLIGALRPSARKSEIKKPTMDG